MKKAKLTDSVSMKAIILLEEGRVVYPKNIQELLSNISITVEVYGEHSGDILENKEEIPYYVTLRKDGTFACSCENSSFVSAKEYKQFWGDIPIRAKAECSHALAAKLHPFYFLWIFNNMKKKQSVNIRCKYRTGKEILITKYTLTTNIKKGKRNVNLSETIKKRKEIDL